MSESYWAIPPEAAERTPLTILREQANALTEATQGRLRGTVSTQRWGGGLAISLGIVVPALENYEVSILKYRQPPLLYPGQLDALGNDGSPIEIHNENEFNAELKAVLSMPDTEKMIAVLLAQSAAVSE